jgi:hypothetical protein
MVSPMKRTRIVQFVAALAVVLISVAAVATVMLGNHDAGASEPDGVGSSADANASRSPVPPGCPATFDAAAGAAPAASRSQFVQAGAEGATLCRYFEPNEAGAFPLLAAYELAGDPDELVEYLNELPDFPPQIESPDPADGIPVSPPCTMALTHKFHVVLHYSDSVHVVVTVNPPCQWVKSDGETRWLSGGIEGLVSHWGMTA